MTLPLLPTTVAHVGVCCPALCCCVLSCVTCLFLLSSWEIVLLVPVSGGLILFRLLRHGIGDISVAFVWRFPSFQVFYDLQFSDVIGEHRGLLELFSEVDIPRCSFPSGWDTSAPGVISDFPQNMFLLCCILSQGQVRIRVWVWGLCFYSSGPKCRRQCKTTI